MSVRALVADDDGARRSVAEQARGNDVCQRVVVALPGQ